MTRPSGGGKVTRSRACRLTRALALSLAPTPQAKAEEELRHMEGTFLVCQECPRATAAGKLLLLSLEDSRRACTEVPC